MIRYIPAQALNFALKDVYKKWFVGANTKEQVIACLMAIVWLLLSSM